MTRRVPISLLAASALIFSAATPALAQDAAPLDAPQSAPVSAEAPQSGTGADPAPEGSSAAAETPADAAPAPEAARAPGESMTLDLLAITDFHGHIERVVDKKTGAVKEPGAQTLACEVDKARAANANTLFVSNGDNVGGSAYISSILKDQPTIDVLNAMKLDVTAAGNHEFDQGITDLAGRIIPAMDAPVLSANVTGNDVLSAEGAGKGTFIKDVAGVRIAFIGLVTEELPTLVSASALSGLTIAPTVETANARAAELKAAGVDLVVVLAHMDGALNANSFSNDVDAFVGGHSHLEYAQVIDRSGKPFAVVQPANYGALLGKISFSLKKNAEDEWTIAAATAENKDLSASDCVTHPEVAAIVAKAKTESEAAGKAVVAQLGSDFLRGTNTGTDTGANRSTESTASNLLADSFRSWVGGIVPDAVHHVGLMNPGGVRADYAAGDLTEGQSFTVQPFGNEMGYGTYTADQLKRVLAQQFQPATSRSALMLGVSDNVKVCLDQAAVAELEGYWKQINGLPKEERPELIKSLQDQIDDARSRVISCLFVDGVELGADDPVVVASNSFLLAGGDGFTVLSEAPMTNTGILDRTATSTYLKELADKGTPAKADLAKRQVGVSGKVEEDGSMTISLAGLLFSATSEQGSGAAAKTVSALVKMPDGSFTTLASQDVDPAIAAELPDTGTAVLKGIRIPAGTLVSECADPALKGSKCADIILRVTTADGQTRDLPCPIAAPAPEPAPAPAPAPTPTTQALAKTGVDGSGLIAGVFALALAGAALSLRKR